MPPPAVGQWQALVRKISAKYSLPFPIVMAQILIESGGSPWATRYEIKWQYFWKDGPLYDKMRSCNTNRQIALNVLRPTEFHLQSSSMGLLQVMGAVAREYGMQEDLSQLYAPEIGIQYGCLYLSSRLKAVNGDMKAALQAYNGSSSYVEKILACAAIMGE